MTALGQQPTLQPDWPGSALPPKPDLGPRTQLRLLRAKGGNWLSARPNESYCQGAGPPNILPMTSLPRDSKHRPWLSTMRSGRQEWIFANAALAFRCCNRSGGRMPKNICPRGWYIPLSLVAVRQGSGILSNSMLIIVSARTSVFDAL